MSPGKGDRSPSHAAKPPALPALHMTFAHTARSDAPPHEGGTAALPRPPARPAPLAVQFTLDFGDGGCTPESTVLLKGAWDSWTAATVLRPSAAASRFEVSIPLEPAVYQACLCEGSCRAVMLSRHAPAPCCRSTSSSSTAGGRRRLAGQRCRWAQGAGAAAFRAAPSSTHPRPILVPTPMWQDASGNTNNEILLM